SGDDGSKAKKNINPGHVREIDAAGKVPVRYLVSVGAGTNNAPPEFGSSDDEEDELVDNLLNRIHSGFPFSNSNFTGGMSKTDVNLMREEAKKDNNPKKTSKAKPKQSDGYVFDAEYVANAVKNSVAEDLSRIQQQVQAVGVTFTKSQSLLQTNIQGSLDNFRREILKVIKPSCTDPSPTPANTQPPATPLSRTTPVVCTTHVDACNIIKNAMRFANQDTSQSSEVHRVEGHEDGEQHIAVGNPNASGDDIVSHTEASATEGAPVGTHDSTGVVGDMVSHTEGYGAEGPPVGTHDASGAVDELDLLTDEQLAEGAAAATETEQKHMMEVDIIASKNRCEHSNVAAVTKISTSPLVDSNAISKMNVETVTEIPNPTFSLGLTQEDPHPNRTYPPVGDNCDLATNDDVPANAAEHDDMVPPYRKSKRAKVVPRGLVGDYQCDKGVLTRAWEAHVAAISSIPNNDYPAKVYSLSEKLNDSFVINVCGLSIASGELSLIVDRTAHLPAKVVDVRIRHTHGMISKELRPIAQMFPFLLRQAGKQIGAKDLKTLTVERPRSVPQNYSQFDYGINASLLIQAHAVGGVDVCKCITEDVLDTEVETAVMIYEDNVGVL
ncbi:unnamed protein product, partial [Brassica oleracea var. botrytis]